MNRNEFHQRQAAGQISGIVKTVRYGDHITIKYWDLDEESDKLLDYRNRNQGKALIKETHYL